MKTTFIIATILSLQFLSGFASNTDTKSVSGTTNTARVEMNTLAPVTPAEATFEDAESAFSEVDVFALAPLTPGVATFDEISETGSGRVLSGFAPVTPLEADFFE